MSYNSVARAAERLRMTWDPKDYTIVFGNPCQGVYMPLEGEDIRKYF